MSSPYFLNYNLHHRCNFIHLEKYSNPPQKGWTNNIYVPHEFNTSMKNSDSIPRISAKKSLDGFGSHSHRTSRKLLRQSNNKESQNSLMSHNAAHRREYSNVLMQNNTIDVYETAKPKEQSSYLNLKAQMTSRPDLQKSLNKSHGWS